MLNHILRLFGLQPSFGRFNHTGIQYGCLAHEQPTIIQLLVDFLDEFIGQARFGQFILVLQGIGKKPRPMAKDQNGVSLKGQPIVELHFELWIAKFQLINQLQGFYNQLWTMPVTSVASRIILIEHNPDPNQVIKVDGFVHVHGRICNSSIVFVGMDVLVSPAELNRIRNM